MTGATESPNHDEPYVVRTIWRKEDTFTGLYIHADELLEAEANDQAERGRELVQMQIVLDQDEHSSGIGIVAVFRKPHTVALDGQSQRACRD